MICPECGHEVPDGHMYCDVCGKEFHMVPEFEPEIENQIDKTLSRLASKIEERMDGDQERAARARQKKPSGERKAPRAHRKGFGVRFVAVAALLILLAAIFLVTRLHKSSGDYVRLASKAYAAGDVAQALEYAKKADEMTGNDAEIILTLAQYYRETGDAQSALSALERVINSAAFDEDAIRRAYALSAEILIETNDFAGLRALMERCPFADVMETYAAWLPDAPRILTNEGTYEGDVEIYLSAADDTTIYYTLDGDEPDATKTRYGAPFEITEPGAYTVKAVAINAYGALSDVVSGDFIVEEKAVPAPRVMEDSGDYTSETKIIVVADDDLKIVYATGEDAEVDEDAEEYTEPIEMPAGESWFHFACVDEKGRLSEIVSRRYHLELERAVSTAQAVSNVTGELIRIGVLADASGRPTDGGGALSFEVEGTVTFGDDGEFYFIREYRAQGDGRREPTGLLYAVNTKTGLTRRLGYDSRGQMMLDHFG